MNTNPPAMSQRMAKAALSFPATSISTAWPTSWKPSAAKKISNRPQSAAFSPNGSAACPRLESLSSAMAFASKPWPATTCASSKSRSASRRPWLMSDPTFRSGFVSIIGRPNAGKSTLLNALVGQKVAIVTDKPQTTRISIQGVLTLPDAQIVFLDTPGIHQGDTPLNKRMMDAVRAALEQRDALVFVADAGENFGDADRRALDLLRKTGTP